MRGSIERMLVLCLLVVGVSAPHVARADAPATRQTLPATVVPVHYDLALSPDATALAFRGDVGIIVDVAAPGQDIVLNAEGLAFDRVAIDGGQPGGVTIDAALGRATLHFAIPFAAGRHRLAIAYHGVIGRTTLGFFAMDYDTPAGRGRTLGTNLEPASARQLLPCWDEPGRKATFTISVIAPTDQMAISNMPIAEVTPVSAGKQRVRFAESPKMSTYLLFLGIGDFERIHRQVDGVDVGVVVSRGDGAKAAYALDQAVALLHYYNGYFGVAFPLPKLDLIAAPGKIDGGSMENWGAIFYSQEHLLFDPARSTENDRQLVFEVVAHEMAHQWFGDLVTMAWWDDLWLNEGFARWMQSYAADALHPEWETGLQAQSIFEHGKSADALPSTHPVVQSILTAEQASQSFDNITYDKGAAVITMLHDYIGAGAFRDGVRRYMAAHAFGNTVDTDLWSIMQQVAGKPILKIERDFTRQEGLPLIEVATTGDAIHLVTSRFRATPDSAAIAPVEHWTLPLAITAPGSVPQQILLTDVADIPVHLPVIVNTGQTGYARIHYAKELMAALLPTVATMAPVDQLGLLNDATALGLAGVAPADTIVAIAAGIPADANPIVWRRVIAVLKNLDGHYDDTAGRAAFRKAARTLLAPVAGRTGAGAQASEAAGLAILRDEVTQALGAFGDLAVIAQARKLTAGGTGSPAEVRTALEIAAAQADPATFDVLLARARATRDPLAKQQIYQALSHVQNQDLAKRMIAVALTQEVPAGSNVAMLIPLARAFPDIAWDMITPHLADAGLALDRPTVGGRRGDSGILGPAGADFRYPGLCAEERPARIAQAFRWRRSRDRTESADREPGPAADRRLDWRAFRTIPLSGIC